MKHRQVSQRQVTRLSKGSKVRGTAKSRSIVSYPLADKRKRDAAFRRLMALLEKGAHLGGGKFVREEAYED